MPGNIRRGNRGGHRDGDPQLSWCPGACRGSESRLLDTAAAVVGLAPRRPGAALGPGAGQDGQGPRGRQLGGRSGQDSGVAGGGQAGGAAGSRHQL